MTKEPEITLRRGTLSDDDLDVLSGMMIIFMHSAEKCLQIMERHYEAEYRAGNDYKSLCKLYGKSQAERILGEQVKRLIRGDERCNLGKILRTADMFHKQMETLTNTAMSSHSDDITDIQSFDAIEHDINFLCYCYALMGNCNGADDEIKILSTVKALAKGDRVSDNVLTKLNYQ